jgi:hypothetical protein
LPADVHPHYVARDVFEAVSWLLEQGRR